MDHKDSRLKCVTVVETLAVIASVPGSRTEGALQLCMARLYQSLPALPQRSFSSTVSRASGLSFLHLSPYHILWSNLHVSLYSLVLIAL